MQQKMQQKKWMTITGYVLAAGPVLLLLMSCAGKLSHSDQILQAWTPVFGYPESTLLGVGLAELLAVVLFAVPRTSVLGAIVMTGYLGGAVATHVRASQPFFTPILVGVVAWASLWLRDARVRELTPIRR